MPELGTLHVVLCCRARDKATRTICALKKIKMEKERDGFPLTSIREINILLCFHHKNIVDVSEVVVGKGLDDVYMVMEFMEHDLKDLMETMPGPFTVAEVRSTNPAAAHTQPTAPKFVSQRMHVNVLCRLVYEGFKRQLYNQSLASLQPPHISLIRVCMTCCNV